MSDSANDERPLISPIEFIWDGHVFLARGGKHILLEAPALFWMRQGELFRYIFPKGKNGVNIFFAIIPVKRRIGCSRSPG